MRFRSLEEACFQVMLDPGSNDVPEVISLPLYSTILSVHRTTPRSFRLQDSPKEQHASISGLQKRRAYFTTDFLKDWDLLFLNSSGCIRGLSLNQSLASLGRGICCREGGRQFRPDFMVEGGRGRHL